MNNGLELDFGFGLPEGPSGNGNGNNGSAFAAGPTSALGQSSATSAASDFLGLSNFFDASPPTNSNSRVPQNVSGASAWQKKSLFDQQQLHHQQQELEQNSLNALMSQHSQQQPQQLSAQTTSVASATPNPFAAFGGMAPQAQDDLEASLQAFSSQQQQASGGNSEGKYMFVATIVDPNQEDATPQQMIFLPGSNQVIPMPSHAAPAAGRSASATLSTNTESAQGLMMSSLANLPVVFPGSGQTKNSAARQQQHHHLMGLSNLEESFTAAFNIQRPPASTADSWLQGYTPTSSGLDQLHHDRLAVPPLQLQQNMSLKLLPQATGIAKQQAETKLAEAAMPIRPLSAYNFFFSDERERILQNKTSNADDEIFDNSKKQRLLLQHLAKDRSKRRPHRKTHGKINFTTLSKLIGQRWKSLPDERKNFYREVAAVDLERYQRELRERSPPSPAS